MSSWRKRGLRLGLYLLLLPAAASGVDLFTIDSPAKWQRWQMPEGLVEIGAEGHLELVRFRKEINAVLDGLLDTPAAVRVSRPRLVAKSPSARASTTANDHVAELAA